MFGLPLIDVLVIVVYFAVVLDMGVWASRRIHSEEGFFYWSDPGQACQRILHPRTRKLLQFATCRACHV